MSSNKTLGREAVIEVNGKRYTISRVERRIVDKFLTFVKKNRPDPFALIVDRLKDFTPEIQRHMIDRAQDKALSPVTYGSQEYQDCLATPEGSYHFLYLLFQKHHPDLSEKEVANLYNDAVDEHGFGYIERKMQEAEGTIPTENTVTEDTLVEFGLVPEKKG